MDTNEYQPEAEQMPPPPADEVSVEVAVEAAPSQDEIESQLSSLKAGQIVQGLVVQIDEQGALVDVGTKSEGHVSREDLADGMNDEGAPLSVGDRISVYVVKTEDEEGNPVLSKKRADYEKVWDRIIEAHEQGEPVTGMVVERVKGGLVVDLGLRGFLPASHVRTKNVHALDRFVGQSLKVKVLEVDRARKRVVVSHKEVVDEERQRRREQTIQGMEENKVVRGVVRRITDYGAFVDIGGVDGLLHVTEMSWTRINHPSEVVKVGDRIDVMILRFDREQNRISLGLKQILPDPWEHIAQQYKVGQIVTGTVTRVVPFGAFVKLDETGIEAIIPNSELPGDRGIRASDVLKTGQQVEVKIVNIRSGERRMTLSLRQFEQAKERQRIRDYMQLQEESSRVTIGDLFGNMLVGSQTISEAEEEEPPSVAAPAPEPAAAPTALPEEIAPPEPIPSEEPVAAPEINEPAEPSRELASNPGDEPCSSSVSPAE